MSNGDLWDIGMETDAAQEELTALSTWFDEHNSGIDPQFNLVMRFLKVVEENGEMMAEIIGMLGQNPRKGVTSDLDHVIKEGLDGVVSLLGAVESATGNKGEAFHLLANHISAVYGRMLQQPALAEVKSNVKIDKFLDAQ